MTDRHSSVQSDYFYEYPSIILCLISSNLADAPLFRLPVQAFGEKDPRANAADSTCDPGLPRHRPPHRLTFYSSIPGHTANVQHPVLGFEKEPIIFAVFTRRVTSSWCAIGYAAEWELPRSDLPRLDFLGYRLHPLSLTFGIAA